jgi:hypothetical protein
MKKTIIASAIAAAVAAPAAFADVSISGQINQEFVTTDEATNVNGLKHDQNVDIVFKASEDLGNGMKAFATIAWVTDNNTTTSANTNAQTASAASFTAADQIVGISGSFGTIMTGKFEDFTEGKVAAAFANDAVDALSVEDGRGETGRTEGGIAYVSPDFNGIHFGVGAYALQRGFGTAGTSAGGNGSDWDATDIYVAYSNGPLKIQAAKETVEQQNTSTAIADKETTSFAVSYTMGDLDFTVGSRDVDNYDGVATNDAKATYIGARYKMGNNTFAVAQNNESGTSATDEVLYSVSHNLSKNVAVYAGYLDSDSSTGDKTAAGIQMKF